MSNIIPKIVVNNKKIISDKVLDKLKTLCELHGQKNALINQQTDIWIKIENIQTEILKLDPPKKKRYNSNVY
jgi:hypothetical protein|tara:strand:- start:1425 stop:1640 length:216 start_codon:yes stop_codon:yes gene_type:complete